MTACERIFDELRNGRRCVLLRGAAGTGKTTLVRELLPRIRELGYNPVLMAPTGRAAKVLELRTRCPARTIHASIYDPPSEPTWDEKLQTWRWKFGLQGTIPGDAVIVVDESSMVGLAVHADENLVFGTGSLLKDLVTWSGIRVPECRNRIIFVGDPYQLPPVGDSGAPPALNPAVLEELTGQEPFVVELKTVHRQSEGSGILQEAMRLRTCLAGRIYGCFSYEEHDDVKFVGEDKVLDLYHPELDIDRKIILAQTNERVWNYNKAVRTLLGRKSADPVPGERLLSLRNTSVGDSEGDTTFRNGDLLQAISVGERVVVLDGYYRIPGSDETLHFPFTFREMSVIWTNEPDRAEVSCWMNISPIASEEWRANDKYASVALYVAVLNNIRERHRDELAALDAPSRKAKLREYIERSVLLRAPVITFGYALTVHKAQGGDWDDVWVDCRYASRQNTEDYFRWAYTAVTRARKRLMIVEAPRIDDLVAALSRGIEVRANTGGPDGAPTPAARPVAVRTLGGVLDAGGYALRRREALNWMHRCFVGRLDDAAAECGWIDVIHNSKGIVSNLAIHVSDLEEKVRENVLALKRLPVETVMGADRPAATQDEGPEMKVFPQPRAVADRLVSAARGRLTLVSAISMGPYQLRVSLRTELGDGYVDWYFNGKGAVTEMGNATLSVAALEILREGLKGAGNGEG